MLKIGSIKAVVYKNLIMNKLMIILSIIFGTLIGVQFLAAKDKTKFPISLVLIFAIMMVSVNLMTFMSFLLVEDRANKFKIVYKVMGLRRNQYFIGSVLSSVVMTSIIQIALHLILMLFKVANGFEIKFEINEKQVFILSFFHYLLITFVSFTISYAFKKIETARSITSILYPLTLYVTFYLVIMDKNLPLQFISPFSEMIYLARDIVFEPNLSEVNITYLVISLSIKSFIWAVIAIYLENVITNDDDHGKHPLFFIQYFLNLAQGRRETPLLTDQEVGIDSSNDNNIKVQYLCKKFGKFKALSDVNVELQAGKINCLLGHNGAGKSTFINILIGMYKATSGKMTWMGEDLIQMHHDENEKLNIGICPPTNILWDKMTVRQHLRMMCFIKNVQNPDVVILDLLNKFNLFQYIDFKTSELSGGNKRKLTIAMTFVGDPNIILFDEPTSALDPVARKDIWEILLNLRNTSNNKIILLTTHHLEEAERLADNIIFLAGGTVKLIGTVDELKKNFGLGYLVEITTENEQKRDYFLDLKKKIEIENGSNFVFNEGDFHVSDRKLELKVGLKDKINIEQLIQAIKKQKPEGSFVTIGTNTLERAYIEIDKKLHEGAVFVDDNALKSILDRMYTPNFHLSYLKAVYLIVKNKLVFLIHNALELMKLIAQYSLMIASAGILLYVVHEKKVEFNKHFINIIMLVFVYFELILSTYSVFNLVFDSSKDIKQVMLANKIPPLIYFLSKWIADLGIFIISYGITFSLISYILHDLLIEKGLWDTYCLLLFLVFCWKITYTFAGYLFYRFFSTTKSVVYYYALFYFGIFFLFNVLSIAVWPKLAFLNDLLTLYTMIFDDTITYKNIFFVFACQSLAYLFITVCIENRGMLINFMNSRQVPSRNRSNMNQNTVPINQEEVDQIKKKLKESVLTEEEKTFDSSETHKVKIINLKKAYGWFFKNTAVNEVTFNISPKTNFGLIGPNGAGKSTLFNMILSKINKTSGNIHVDKTPNYDMFSPLYKFFTPYEYNNYGICFQGDSTWEELSVGHNLDFYSELNGIQKDAFKDLLVYFEFDHYLEKNAEDLSSGNKRKLCILISLMTNPNFLLYDEATCGIDINMRLRMKNLVEYYKNKNQLFSIFTTHFLKDIEIFCDKIGIIDRGEFLCIETIDQIKQTLGGYLMTIQFKNYEERMPIIREIAKLGSTKIVAEEPAEAKSKLILTSVTDVFSLFSVLLGLQTSEKIVDFSLNQLSIEDIYLDVFNRSE